MTVTDEQLANLRRLAEQATPGPWVAVDAEFISSASAGGTVANLADVFENALANNVANGDFIAAARTAVPELLDALAAMTQRAEAAEAKLAAIPLTSLLYCWYAEDGEREDEAWEDHAGAVGAWLDKFSNEAQPAPVLTEDDMYISPYALPPSPDEQEAQP